MSTQSDITLDPSKFTPSATPQDVRESLLTNLTVVPGWPAQPPHPSGQDAVIPSRDAGRALPVRILHPENGKASKGIYMYIHGGGWSTLSEKDFDGRLLALANASQLTAISVGYRLAPAHPFPAATDDCIDAALYLASPEGRQKFGGLELRAIGGESAGAHLTATTALQLAKTKPEAAARLAGLVLIYGIYDLTLSLPSMVRSVPGKTVMLDRENTATYVDMFMLPERATAEQRRAPEVSPLFEDLEDLAARLPGSKLPPALFICGTGDSLLDDTIMMSVKWLATGSEAVVKVYPGAPHVFDFLPGKDAEDATQATCRFLSERV